MRFLYTKFCPFFSPIIIITRIIYSFHFSFVKQFKRIQKGHVFNYPIEPRLDPLQPKPCYLRRHLIDTLSFTAKRNTCWGRPSTQDQKTCINKSGTFNYDDKYQGVTAKSLSSLQEDKGFSKDGFLLNNTRVLLGSGAQTFEKGKTALRNWRQFGLNWAFVDPETPVKQGAKFCVCVKEFLPWFMMPLQVVYVNETKTTKKRRGASFGFGSGTLHGHLLAGEERFSIEIDENSQVWYEIVSVSKPAHVLSIVGYPYVMLRQKYFAHESGKAMQEHINSSNS